jgi:hypothetical protein
MKACYLALLDIYSEIDQKIGEGRSYRIKYARAAVRVYIYIYSSNSLHVISVLCELLILLPINSTYFSERILLKLHIYYPNF